MAIDKKLIRFKTKANFMSQNGVNGDYSTPSSGSESDGNAIYGQIMGSSIVYIEDSKEIWTHGNLYKSVNWSVLYSPELFATLTIDDANSDPAIPVTGDTDWIVGRRCLAKNTSDGVAICYLSDTDSTKFADGADAALDGSMGEFMVDFPASYVTATEVDGVTTVKVSDTEGTAEFRRVLLGATHGTLDTSSGKMRAVAGYNPTTNKNIVEFHDAAVLNGSGWDIMDYETRNKVTTLAYAKYGTRNLQDVVGLGDSSCCFEEGCTTSLGNANGEVTNADGKICNSILGVENYFNNVGDWMGGIHEYLDADGSKATFYIYDGVDVDNNGAPEGEYRTITVDTTVGGLNISKMLWGEHADLFPSIGVDDSAFATYYSDAAYVVGSDVGITNRARVVLVGGYGAFPGYGGALFLAGYGPAGANSRIGARLQYRGNIKVIENSEEFKQIEGYSAIVDSHPS